MPCVSRVRTLNLAASGSGARESDLANIHVRSQELSNFTTTVDDIDRAWWEALLDQRTQRKSTKRRLLRWLVDESIASGQGWSGLPAEQHSRDVPGSDTYASSSATAYKRIRMLNAPEQTPIGSRCIILYFPCEFG